MTTPVDDHRLGLPSASAMYRIDACNGSHLAAREVVAKLAAEKPVGITEENIPALIGNITHAWLCAKSQGEPIVEAEQYKLLEPHGDRAIGIANQCWQQRTELLDKFLPGFDGEENPAHIIHEQRLWLTTSGHRKWVSGQPDVLAHRNRLCVVIDYKTGSESVTEADGNWQLRTLAACAKQAVDPDAVIVAIIQPACGQPTIAHYDRKALEESVFDCLNLAKLAMSPKSKRVAGLHCTYCAARGHCKEAAQYVVESIEPITAVAAPTATKDDIEALVLKSSLADCAAVWKKRRPVKWVMDAITARLKGTNADTLATLGLKTKPGKLQSEYHSLPSLFEGLDLSFDEFLGCCSLSKDKLTTKVAEKYKLAEAQAGRQVEMMLADFKMESRCADELVEVKP